MLAHLYISASLLASLVRAAQNPDNNQVGANGPTSSNPNQAFQERVSIHDNVWFDIKHGGEQFYDNERIGWRLKNDDASAVIHMYNMSDRVVTYDGNLLVDLETTIETTYGATIPSPPAPESQSSTWNSTAPFVPQPMSQYLAIQEVCNGASVSFRAALTFANGTTATHNDTAHQAGGYSSLEFAVPRGVQRVSVAAYNATYAAAVGVLYYAPDAQPWSAKFGAGPNLPHVSASQTTTVS